MVEDSYLLLRNCLHYCNNNSEQFGFNYFLPLLRVLRNSCSDVFFEPTDLFFLILEEYIIFCDESIRLQINVIRLIFLLTKVVHVLLGNIFYINEESAIDSS